MSNYVVRSVLVGTVAVLALAFSMPARGQEAEKAPKAKKYTGTVEAVDATAKTVTIKKKEGDVKAFTCDAKCKFSTAEKEMATLADFKVGEKVVATYTVEGDKNVCTKLMQAKEKKEKEAK